MENWFRNGTCGDLPSSSDNYAFTLSTTIDKNDAS